MTTVERRGEMAEAVRRAEEDEELEEADAEYARPRRPKDPSQVYSIRIPVKYLEQLRQLATAREVAPSALIRQLVIDHIEAYGHFREDPERHLSDMIIAVQQTLAEFQKTLEQTRLAESGQGRLLDE